MNYTPIVKFKYNNDFYQLFIDDNNKYFFMKINNNILSYVNLKEYFCLLQIFCKKSNTMLIVGNDKKHNKIKIIPKIIIGGISTVLTFSTLLSLCDSKINDLRDSRLAEYYSTHTDEIQQNVSFQIEDKNDELSVDEKLYNNISNTIYIYDMSVLDDYLEYSNVSKEKMIETLNQNNKINARFAPLFNTFINTFYDKYPNAEKRILYENLKTLEVVECSKDELVKITLSYDSYACYVANENKIYVLKGYEYIEGTWEYQVLFHEISHATRTASIIINEKLIKVQSTGNSLSLVIIDEALNSLFTVSLFDREEKDIAYQLQSNYCKIMLECLDNYSLTDYINHSLSYFAKKLDEHNGDNNYACSILSLIDVQYKDFHDDDIQIEQQEYYPIYDYICDMYYSKYITPEMSYSEAKKIADALMDEVTYDVPLEYNIDTNRFYNCLDSYCELIGINIKNNKTL